MSSEDVAVALFGVVIPSIALAQLVIVSLVARSLGLATHRWFVAASVWQFFVLGLCFSSGMSVVVSVSQSFTLQASYSIVAVACVALVHGPLMALVFYGWGARDGSAQLA